MCMRVKGDEERYMCELCEPRLVNKVMSRVFGVEFLCSVSINYYSFRDIASILYFIISVFIFQKMKISKRLYFKEIKFSISTILS